MLLAVLSSAICHSSSFTSNERLKTKHKKKKVEKKEEEWMRKEWAERETERNKKLWWTTTPVLIGLSQPFDVTWTTTHTHRTAMKKYNKHIFTHTHRHRHTQKKNIVKEFWKNELSFTLRLFLFFTGGISNDEITYFSLNRISLRVLCTKLPSEQLC